MFKHRMVSVMILLAVLVTASACKPLGENINSSGDRIDWRPGDRIVLWCDMPDTLVVYGVADDSHGFPLASFKYADLLKAGPRGITKEPAGNNGTVSASVDDQYNFWVAWNGGQYGADGQPDHGFAKGVKCTFGATEKPVDPRPWDHLSVFCNLPDTLVVYGVDNSSRAFLLAKFSYAELVAAGPKGIYTNAGGNGTVSASVDNQNNFWIAWNGGSLGADGQPDHGFAKGIHCPFSR
jgi:hypothetical protein